MHTKCMDIKYMDPQKPTANSQSQQTALLAVLDLKTKLKIQYIYLASYLLYLHV